MRSTALAALTLFLVLGGPPLLRDAAGAGAAGSAVACQEISDYTADVPSGDSGIGGTGRGDEDDSGVGGTGIYGAIRGFGSICVNGLRVHYGSGTEFSRNGDSAGADSLALGRVVWARAHERDGRLVASRIRVLSSLIGQLTQVDLLTRTLRVSGRRVYVPEGAALADGSGTPLELAAFVPGDLLDVSGLARGQDLVASRIERRPHGAALYRSPRLVVLMLGEPSLKRVSIEGFVGEQLGDTHLRIDGIGFQTQAIPQQAQPRHADRIAVLAWRTTDGALRAQRLEPIRDRIEPNPLPPLEPVPLPHVPTPDSHENGDDSAVPPAPKLGASDALDLFAPLDESQTPSDTPKTPDVRTLPMLPVDPLFDRLPKPPAVEPLPHDSLRKPTAKPSLDDAVRPRTDP